MTPSDGRRHEPGGGRADGEPSRGDDPDEEPEQGRFDKYFEYVLDLLSLV
ncbi:hypothetical protein [Halobacterium wangiae]|nr:hypothetical protein [Halobacterium wangiae]